MKPIIDDFKKWFDEEEKFKYFDLRWTRSIRLYNFLFFKRGNHKLSFILS